MSEKSKQEQKQEEGMIPGRNLMLDQLWDVKTPNCVQENQ